MDTDTATSLLESMEANRLVLFAGAGLSMGAPTNIPSAKVVAKDCFDAYELLRPGTLPAANSEDLNALAEHFAARGTLQTYFIPELVPWRKFGRPPNVGHRAIADFLFTRALFAAVTTNYDWLVEESAKIYGAEVDASLDGREANVFATHHAPYLKLHGCQVKAKLETVWAPSQLANDPTIRDRIKISEAWLQGTLLEKDLLFVGFWTDWNYLNGVLEKVLQNARPSSVTVIDPSTSDELELKAPILWALLHSGSVRFKHQRYSGHDALDSLRQVFSKAFLRRAVALGVNSYKTMHSADPSPAELADFPSSDSEELYDLRRDAEGIPSISVATRRTPQFANQYGLAVLALRRAAATMTTGGRFFLRGQSIRVLNGAGKSIAELREAFTMEPPTRNADLVICAGATDLWNTRARRAYRHAGELR